MSSNTLQAITVLLRDLSSDELNELEATIKRARTNRTRNQTIMPNYVVHVVCDTGHRHVTSSQDAKCCQFLITDYLNRGLDEIIKEEKNGGYICEKRYKTYNRMNPNH